MICFVDLEHESVLQHPKRRDVHLATQMDVKLRLEAISGVPCLIQRYGDVSRRRLRELGIRALVISGNAADWPEYDPAALRELEAVIREAAVPILGLCGGLQLIAMAHGGSVAPIRPLEPGEPQPSRLTTAGYFAEVGFMPVRVVTGDPLFEGLPPEPVVLEIHTFEVKTVPDDFEVLASRDDCRVQVMKQVARPVYGTQFHPEAFTEYPRDVRSGLVKRIYPQGVEAVHMHGRTLLANFFTLAGIRRGDDDGGA